MTQEHWRAFPARLSAAGAIADHPRWSDADKDAQLVHRGLYAEYIPCLRPRHKDSGWQTGHDAKRSHELPLWPTVGVRAQPLALRAPPGF